MAGRRRICYEDARLVSLLAIEGQNHHISVPAHLRVWVDAGESLAKAGVLPRLGSYDLSRTMLVVDESSHARQIAEQLKDRVSAGIVCRDWRGTADQRWVAVGPDLDLLAIAALQRVVTPGAVPGEVAMTVPPKWHRC